MPKLENSNETFLVIFKHCAQVKILTKKSDYKESSAQTNKASNISAHKISARKISKR